MAVFWIFYDFRELFSSLAPAKTTFFSDNISRYEEHQTKSSYLRRHGLSVGSSDLDASVHARPVMSLNDLPPLDFQCPNTAVVGALKVKVLSYNAAVMVRLLFESVKDMDHILEK